MSDIETFDDLELRLRRAFHDGMLPVAPARLRQSLDETVAQEPERATERAGRGGLWLVLGVAAALAIGGSLLLAGGGLTPKPSGPTVPTTRIDYRISWTAATPASAAARDEIVSILRSRLVALGLSTATVTSDNWSAAVVLVPTGPDLDAVRRTLGATGRVAFVPLGTTPAGKGDRLDPRLTPLFENAGVASASVGTDQTGLRVIDVTLTPSGTGTFATWTRDHAGQFFAIAVDGTVVTAPAIRNEIPAGDLEISSPGGWDAEEAAGIVAILSSGAFPVQIDEVSFDSVDPILPPAPSASEADLASPTSSVEPTPSPELSCAHPLGLADELSCDAGVEIALAALPAHHPRIERIAFVHDCQDVGFSSSDCLVQAFGRVTMTFEGGGILAFQVSSSSKAHLLTGPGDQQGSRAIRGDAGAACGDGAASPEPAQPIRLRIDPAADPPVTGSTLDGTSVPVRFGTGFLLVTDPVLLIVGPQGVPFGSSILGSDGDVVLVGDAPDGAMATCMRDGAALVTRNPAVVR